MRDALNGNIREKGLFRDTLHVRLTALRHQILPHSRPGGAN